MKRGIWGVCLGVEAVLCVIIGITRVSIAGAFSGLMAFPFEQIGLGLRALSLSGKTGNALALALYFAISLLPLALLLIIRKRRRLRGEEGLLALLCALLFAVLYFMINPGSMPFFTGGEAGQSVGKAVLGGMTYSVIIGYLALRVIRLFSAGDTEKLFRYMKICLCLLNVLFVYAAFGACFNSLLDSAASLRAGNAGNEQLLGATYVFLAAQFFVNALAYVLDVFVVFAALRVLEEMRADRYSAEAVAATVRVSRLCALALAVTVLSGVAANLLQLLFAKWLLVVNGSVQIPVWSIIFVLAALLLTRLVTQDKRLKDENDLFI